MKVLTHRGPQNLKSNIRQQSKKARGDAWKAWYSFKLFGVGVGTAVIGGILTAFFEAVSNARIRYNKIQNICYHNQQIQKT